MTVGDVVLAGLVLGLIDRSIGMIERVDFWLRTRKKPPEPPRLPPRHP